ncbi:hypothetical protein GOP47_0002940 [Adiantum capillus-veneris]|uniref:START domain-containing protein n=1 Tax=Adiantum capillus-veneris TaxID=13818 RepID=A0A9D4ZRS3_ADICA|nr:hypothetical protein GOP47_0002940 [Adiantum capillus-veneris]
MYASKGPLAKRRSLVRSYSLGSSFARCFGGTAAHGPISPTSYGVLMVDKVGYNKLSSAEEGNEDDDDDNDNGGDDNGTNDGGKKGNVLSADKMATKRKGGASSPNDSSASNSLEHPSFGAKVRLACEQMLESAKKSSPHLSELFVGTALLLKVTSTARPPCNQHSLSPSPGFVHISPITQVGAFHLMFADIQVPSPIVPTHQVYFLSSYKMVSEGTWAAVDVSVDNLPGDLPSIAHKCRKRPAGCLIQLLPNGLSKGLEVRK